MDKNVGKVAEKNSSLDCILGKFDEELAQMEKLSASILDKVSLLRNAHSPSPKDDKEAKEKNPGFITELRERLDKMDDLNDVLRQANEGLTESVG